MSFDIFDSFGSIILLESLAALWGTWLLNFGLLTIEIGFEGIDLPGWLLKLSWVFSTTKIRWLYLIFKVYIYSLKDTIFELFLGWLGLDDFIFSFIINIELIVSSGDLFSSFLTCLDLLK